MSSNSSSIEITVLGIKKINDIHNKLDFISPIKGLDFCLIRERSKTNPLPDLFDTSLVTFNQKSKNDEIKFIKEYNPIKKRLNIANSYNAFNNACIFSLFLTNNIKYIPDPHETYTLSLKAFNAFERNLPSDIILFKAIYTFLKDEGFPVKESWLNSLNSRTRSTAKKILSTKLKLTLDQSDAERAKELLIKLTQWISSDTDLKYPN